MVLADSRSFHTERYVRELRRQGCRVLTVSLEHGDLCSYHLSKIGPIKQAHYSLAKCELKKVIARFQPDIVNPHFASGYGHLAAMALASRTVPVVLVLWGSDILVVPNKSIWHRRKTMAALRRADFVFGDSDYLMTSARELVEFANRRVIPWGIEERFLKLHKSDYELGKPLRIIVPRLHEEVYNNEFILESLGGLLGEGKIELAFPSFGSKADRFRRRLNDRQLGSVTLYDKLPRDQFLKYASKFDLYLSASRSDSSPASMIEAMALGLIPVAAEINGIKEWLSPESGFCFPLDDTSALRLLIGQIIASDDTHTAMRRSNLQRVRHDALFEKNVAEQIDVMKELAGRRSADA